jgi:hypothetical protein
VSVLRSPASKFSAALLRGSVANNRMQGFRLVRVIALPPVWVVFFVFLTFECWVLTTGRLQAVCVCFLVSSLIEKAQLRLIYVVIWVTLLREGGCPEPQGRRT